MKSVRPSLNALRAFEVSARLGSISQAAAELGVTPGAVSRHIQTLEGIFGVPLLRRLSQSVMPTDEGGRMAAKLGEGFSIIDASVAQFQPGPLTLSCSATIMMHWLIPQLAAFKRTHPETELRLNVNYSDMDLVREEVSLAIRNDMVRSEEHTSELQSLMRISYAVFCLKKKTRYTQTVDRYKITDTHCS